MGGNGSIMDMDPYCGMETWLVQEGSDPRVTYMPRCRQRFCHCSIRILSREPIKPAHNQLRNV